MADGERLPVGRTEHDGRITEYGVSERVYADIPFETLKKIAASKIVEMKLGHKTVKLKSEHVQAFRDLLSLATP